MILTAEKTLVFPHVADGDLKIIFDHSRSGKKRLRIVWNFSFKCKRPGEALRRRSHNVRVRFAYTQAAYALRKQFFQVAFQFFCSAARRTAAGAGRASAGDSRGYSLRRLFTGFMNAARMLWKLIVASATSADSSAAAIKIHARISVL